MICAGGGGIPTMYEPGADRKLVGVEAVIDKDLCSELLARELDADLFVMATDADAVFTGWGTPEAKAIHKASPAALSEHKFPAGSMGPKVEAACRFAEHHGTDGRHRRAGRHCGDRARREGNDRQQGLRGHDLARLRRTRRDKTLGEVTALTRERRQSERRP